MSEQTSNRGKSVNKRRRGLIDRGAKHIATSGRYKYLLAVSGVALATLAAVTSVVASKVFDLVPSRGSASLVVAVVALVIVMLTYIFFERAKTYAKSSYGTAYYLSLIAATMKDEHETTFREIKETEEYQDYRAVSMKLGRAQNDCYDWTDTVNEFVVQMQESMNEDDVSSGYTLLPNMLFPAAVSFGSQMYFPQEVKFIEVPKRVPGEKISDPKTWAHWDFDGVYDLVEKRPGCDEKEILQDGEVELFKTNKLFSSVEKALNTPGVFYISVQNTFRDGGELRPPEWLKVGHQMSMKPRGYDDALVVSDSIVLADERKRYEARDISNGREVSFWRKDVHAEELLRSAINFLGVAYDRYHEMGANVPIVLAARLPKSVSIAFGQAFDLLKNDRTAASFWENLIIINWEPPGKWRMARVHPAQPPVEEQVDRLKDFDKRRREAYSKFESR